MGRKIGKADIHAQDGTLHRVTERRFRLEWTFCGAHQFTIVGPNYSREKNHVIMSLDGNKIDRSNPSVARVSSRFREDNDFPIVWAKPYGKGRVFYSSFGHEDTTIDDPHIQKMYLGAIKWVLGDVTADITPRPMPKR